MPESDAISSETREELEALCQKVSVSYDLDPMIRKELYGHMEDRLLAHMNGEAPLAEQDAFELVSKQFGDPTVIQELFQGVYLKEMTASIGRRMVAAFAACVIADFFCAFLDMGVAAFFKLFGTHSEPFIIWLYIMSYIAITPGIMCGTLLVWKTRIERGERVWFQTMSSRHILLIFLILALILDPARGSFENWLSLFPSIPYDDILGVVTTSAVDIGLVCSGFLWIWFCSQPPHPRQSKHYISFCFFLSIFISFIPATIYFGITGIPGITRVQLFLGFLVMLFFSAVLGEINLFIYWILAGLYRLTKRFRRNSDEPFQTA